VIVCDICKTELTVKEIAGPPEICFHCAEKGLEWFTSSK
jgi:hypothetical protein